MKHINWRPRISQDPNDNNVTGVLTEENWELELRMVCCLFDPFMVQRCLRCDALFWIPPNKKVKKTIEYQMCK